MAVINASDHYLDYLSRIYTDIEEYKSNLDTINSQKEELHDFISKYITNILNDYKIDLNKYPEWIDKKYNNSAIYTKVDNIFKSEDNSASRIALLQLNKYLMLLKKEDEYNKLIDIAKSRTKLKPRKFLSYLKKYYTVVHKALLEGFGYTFTSDIGVICINFWKMPGNKKPVLDYNATNIARRKLIQQGLRPYKKSEAKEYKEKGIPYDGVQYAVYRIDEHIFDIRLYRCKLLGRAKKPTFKKIEWIAHELKGKTLEEIAEQYVNSFEDIVNLDVSLRNKVSIMNIKYPNSYIKFIRTLDGKKYEYNKYREDNSQD